MPITKGHPAPDGRLKPLRTSERTSFKRCRQKWHWQYEDRLRPKRTSTPLRFGTLVHAALELRYPPGTTRGPHPAETFADLFDREVAENGPMMTRPDGADEWMSARSVGIHMLEAFVDEFGEDDRYETIASEQFFSIPVRSKKRGTSFRYVGTIDGVWRDLTNDQIVLIDWKTAASIRTNHLALDDQAAAYLAFGVPALERSGVLAGRDCNRIMYTFMRKAEPDSRTRNADGLYLNKDGSVSKKQPPPMFERVTTFKGSREIARARNRAIHEAREMEMVRLGSLAVLKTTGSMTCGMCEFRDMCEVHEAGGDWHMYADSMFERWDPYARDEIEDGERR